MYIRVCSICVLSVLFCNQAAAATIDVRIFNLPSNEAIENLTPIPDGDVRVRVFNPEISNGEAVRDDDTGQINNDGAPFIDSEMGLTPSAGVTRRGVGHFTITIPATGRRLVNIEFFRENQVPATQILNGFIVEGSNHYSIDVTVPRALPRKCSQPVRCYKRRARPLCRRGR